MSQTHIPIYRKLVRHKGSFANPQFPATHVSDHQIAGISTKRTTSQGVFDRQVTTERSVSVQATQNAVTTTGILGLIHALRKPIGREITRARIDSQTKSYNNELRTSAEVMADMTHLLNQVRQRWASNVLIVQGCQEMEQTIANTPAIGRVMRKNHEDAIRHMVTAVHGIETPEERGAFAESPEWTNFVGAFDNVRANQRAAQIGGIIPHPGYACTAPPPPMPPHLAVATRGSVISAALLGIGMILRKSSPTL